MPKITKIAAQEVLDSRGWPTVMVEVFAEGGFYGRGIVPSGSSTGSKEALELRDNNKNRFKGKGVLQAVKNVNTTIAKCLVGQEVENIKKLDAEMIALDGTPNKSNLGANAILGVSIAACYCAANAKGIPLYQFLSEHYGYATSKYVLPVPFFNIINGGEHGDNDIDFQEYLIAPVGAKNLCRGVQMASEVFHTLEKILKSKKLNTGKGDEGGFAPQIENNQEPFRLITQAISEAGYVPGKDLVIAIDLAASEFYNQETKLYRVEGKDLTSDQLIKYVEKITKDYPLVSVEDGLSEYDWEGFAKLTAHLGKKIQMIGDDIFVTNPEIMQRGIDLKTANSVLIKVNQIGSVSETVAAVRLAQENGWTTMISHRSGETEDTFIADFSVAVQAKQIKSGSMSRTERIAKYNRLMYIEREVAEKGKYTGRDFFPFVK